MHGYTDSKQNQTKQFSNLGMTLKLVFPKLLLQLSENRLMMLFNWKK